MKKIISTLIALCIGFAATAQKEYAMTDTIHRTFDLLKVESDWVVRLIQNDDSVCTISIIIDDDQIPPSGTTTFFTMKKKVLTIPRNTSLPQGTLVEISGPLALETIDIKEGGSVIADQFTTTNDTYIYLSSNTQLHIGHLNTGKHYTYISSGDFSDISLDTISGSDLEVRLSDHDHFYYGVNQLTNMLDVHESVQRFDIPYYSSLLLYQYQSEEPIVSDSANHISIIKEYKRKWTLSNLTLGIALGERQSYRPKTLESPYATGNTIRTCWFLGSNFNISKHWKLNTGLQFDVETTDLLHQVVLDGNNLVNDDAALPAKKNTFYNEYLGIPIRFIYDKFPNEGHTAHIGADVFFGRRVLSRMMTKSLDENNTHTNNWDKENIDIFNPWRLELGVSLTTNAIGIFHGCRFFVNLLPEYRKNTLGEDIHSFGLELCF